MEKTVVFVLVSGAFVTIPSLGMVIVLREIVRMVQIFQVLIVCLVVKMGNVKVPLIPMGLVSLMYFSLLW
jgi:hypothetical protein